MTLARAAIIRATADEFPVKGGIACPNCGKVLYFVRHHNGHIHAKCETEGCTNWIE
jgi:hypothetical protein